MTTRVTFNFEGGFLFQEDRSYTSIDLDLVTRITNDYVRFARYIKAMVVEHPPRLVDPTDMPITRFVAVSPGLTLQTSGLPTGSSAAGYLREALKPLLAHDGSLYDYTQGEFPPKDHYSVEVVDDSQFGAQELREELVALRSKVEGLLEALESQAESESKTTTKKKSKAKKKAKTKKK